MSEDMNAEQTEGTTAEASPQKKKGPLKRWQIAVVTVVAIFVVAGAGMWVWHEQPSFCNAICHDPMDPYLPTYEAQPGAAAVDKWGNEVADASGMMAATHRVEAEADCMSCHIPTMSEQISEGITWISGNFFSPLVERNASDLTEARGVPSDEFCLNEACHNMTRDDLIAATDGPDVWYNPHVPEHGELDCGTCHKAHRQSVVICSQCHNDVEIPEGWLDYDGYTELTNRQPYELQTII